MQRLPTDFLARVDELREFLSSRRARIEPHEAGLRTIGRRRSPGLTREDVARLAGVSFKWYGRFESGRAFGVSRRFLERISAALALNRAERQHLYSLVGFTDPTGDNRHADSLMGLRPLVQELENVPAVVCSPLFDVLCFNRSYDCIFRQSAQSNGIRSNILWRMFLDPYFRGLWCDWAYVARNATARLRHINGFQADSAPLLALTAELSRSSDFVSFWSCGDVFDLTERCPLLEINVPTVGTMTLEVSTIVQNESPRLMFVAFVPNDDGARQRIALAREIMGRDDSNC
jgi:transcriptional regulator with XRE-family HTH domain